MVFEDIITNNKLEIKNALISVYDKKGIADFVKELENLEVEIFSTGKTKEVIEKNGNKTRGFSEYTKQKKPKNLKRLQSGLYEGILLHPEKEMHETYMQKKGIEKIDMVVCNLYPIEDKLEKIYSNYETPIYKKIEEHISRENLEKIKGLKKREVMNKIISYKNLGSIIEVGKVSLIRASAKAALEYGDIAIVTNPDSYNEIISELEENENFLSEKRILNLAKDAFIYTNNYEKSIVEVLKSKN